MQSNGAVPTLISREEFLYIHISRKKYSRNRWKVSILDEYEEMKSIYRNPGTFGNIMAKKLNLSLTIILLFFLIFDCTCSASGIISISSVPSGATVVLDGVNIGETTPVSLENVSRGSHLILLNLTGYQDWAQNVSVNNDVTSEISITLIPTPPLPPTSDFTVYPVFGNPPLTVMFTDKASGSSDATSWAFGDENGTGATVQNPVHTYLKAGNYTVSLTVANSGGSDTKTWVDYISVSNATDNMGIFRNGVWYLDWNGDYAWDAVDGQHIGYFGQAGDIPVVGDWNGNGTGKIGIFRNGVWYLDWNGDYAWDATDAQHIGYFGQAGDIPVVGDWNGNGTGKIGIFRNGVWYLDWNGDYAWDATDAQHIGYFGQAGDIPVVGDWNGNGTGKIGIFRNGVWYLDWNGDYAWDAADAQHIGYFGQAGDIPVVGDWNGNGTGKMGIFRNGVWYLDWNGDYAWDATDAQHIGYFGQAGDKSVPGFWSPNPPGATLSSPPVTIFTGAPSSGVVPLTVAFTDSSINSPTSWVWNFGDGGTSNLPNPSHQYSSVGTYAVTLTTANAEGSGTNVKTGFITVTAAPAAPVASFSADMTSGDSPLTVKFKDTSTGTGPLSYVWNFDDGGTSTRQNPSHIFDNPGTYTITLSVTNAAGSDYEQKTEYIVVTSHDESNAGIALTFDDNSIDAWYGIRDILQRHGAHVTFFVSNLGNIDHNGMDKLRQLQADGNEIAFHGYNHEDEVEYLQNHTLDEYMNNEIYRGIDLMASWGLKPVDFAYPYGHDDPNATRVLEENFTHMRDTSYDWEDSSIYHQYGSNQAFISGIGIDDITYNNTRDINTIYNGISKAKTDERILIFYGHETVLNVTDVYQTSYERIEQILQYASENDMKTYTISEIH